MVYVTPTACRNESHPSSVFPSSFLSGPSHPQFLQTQSGMSIGGTYRYHPRAYPAVGEGLVLEEVSLVPSRQSVRLLAEQNKMIDSESNPTTGVRKMLTEGRVGAEFVMEMSPPLPPDMTNTCEVRGEVQDRDWALPVREERLVSTAIVAGKCSVSVVRLYQGASIEFVPVGGFA